MNMESVKKKLDEAKSELSSQVMNISWLYELFFSQFSSALTLGYAPQAAHFAAEMGKVAKDRDAHHMYVYNSSTLTADALNNSLKLPLFD